MVLRTLVANVGTFELMTGTPTPSWLSSEALVDCVEYEHLSVHIFRFLRLGDPTGQISPGLCKHDLVRLNAVDGQYMTHFCKLVERAGGPIPVALVDDSTHGDRGGPPMGWRKLSRQQKLVFIKTFEASSVTDFATAVWSARSMEAGHPVE